MWISEYSPYFPAVYVENIEDGGDYGEEGGGGGEGERENSTRAQCRLGLLLLPAEHPPASVCSANTQ